MNTALAAHRLPLWTRTTAAFAALLVLALAIFSASPTAHAWLHAHDGGMVSAHANGDAGPDQTRQGQGNDDGCAVVLFSTGVLVTFILLILAGAFRQIVEISFGHVAAIHRAKPRYWLPPMCGPPLN